jgi:hypothetical protein
MDRFRARQERCQPHLALAKLTAPPICALQLDQVERQQDHVTIATPAAQCLEVSPSVGTADNPSPSIRKDSARMRLAAGPR